jgi:hypothetical protein
MIFHLLEVAVLILLAGFGALAAFIRHGLRPRRARLDGRGGVLLLHSAKSNRLPDLAPSLSNRLALEIGEAARAATPILLLTLRAGSVSQR